MKKLLLITVIFILQLFPSLGDPIGKGIICKCIEEKCTLKKRGHYFSKNKVKVHYFKREKDEIIIKFKENDYYRVTSSNIEWKYYDSGNYSLDRKTLKLTIDFPSFNKKIYSQCTLYKGFHFNREIRKLRKYYQKEYDKKIKDNKI